MGDSVCDLVGSKALAIDELDSWSHNLIWEPEIRHRCPVCDDKFAGWIVNRYFRCPNCDELLRSNKERASWIALWTGLAAIVALTLAVNWFGELRGWWEFHKGFAVVEITGLVGAFLGWVSYRVALRIHPAK